MIIKENVIEQLFADTFNEIGYQNGEIFNDLNLQQIINENLLRKTLLKINNLQNEYIDEAINKILHINASNSLEANIKTLKWLKSGISIKIQKYSDLEKTVKLIDYENIENNVFQYIRQFEFYSNNKKWIPDILIFINGIPISLIELKSFEAKEKLEDAYLQVKNYARQNLNLMYWNVFSLVSNGFKTKYGAVTNDFEHWYSWKKINIDDEIIQDVDYEDENAKNNFHKNIVGIFSKKTLLNLIKNYIFYSENKNSYIKYTPTYYQYFSTEKILHSIEIAKHGRVGVVWHTQGSGKSVTMVFLASRIKSYFKNINYKIIFVTDRNDLDNQLFQRFCSAVNNYLLIKPKRIDSREELINVLSNDNDFGIYFTTIQKFTKTSEPLSEKSNVIIIADEAHRSQNNIEGEYVIDKENKVITLKEGYAKYMRDAFPNAKFIAFTGTPLKGHKKTTDIFGDYIDKYKMNQAVLDGSTVPIHYEKRRAILNINESIANEIDQIMRDDILINSSESQYINNAKFEFVKKKVASVKNILKNNDVIKTIVSDFWKHYEIRKTVLNGKVMFVAFDREIAFLIYKEMIHQQPEYKDNIHLIITSSNKDSEELAKVIPNEKEKNILEQQFKDPNSNFKIAIVVDMWLTGFDVPDLDTLYLFKIIKWHNLMQTIARVNRTYNFENKIKYDGLVVDYIGIWKYISEALKEYSDNSNDDYDIDKVRLALVDRCLQLSKIHIEITKYLKMWCNGDNKEKFNAIINGTNYILGLEIKNQDLFFASVNKISRHYKLCQQILSKIEKLTAQYFILIKNIIRNQNVEEAIDIEQTINKIKDKMTHIVNCGDIEISKIPLDGRKDLAFVMSILNNEIHKYKEQNVISNLKVKELENQVKNQINNFKTTNPIKAQELSSKLREIISKFEQDKNFEEILLGLRKMVVLMQEQNELISESGFEDENLRSFYSVLTDPKYKIEVENSEVFRSIVLDIHKLIKKHFTHQWQYNKNLQLKIKNEIKKLLFTKYHYPPNEANLATNDLYIQIQNIIRRDVDYFLNEEDK